MVSKALPCLELHPREPQFSRTQPWRRLARPAGLHAGKETDHQRRGAQGRRLHPLRAAQERGLDVPEDLSVVGFVDITMADYTDPPLTTVGLVKEHLGRRAIARLLELVEGTDSEVKLEIVPVQLVVRQSTASPVG